MITRPQKQPTVQIEVAARLIAQARREVEALAEHVAQQYGDVPFAGTWDEFTGERLEAALVGPMRATALAVIKADGWTHSESPESMLAAAEARLKKAEEVTQ